MKVLSFHGGCIIHIHPCARKWPCEINLRCWSSYKFRVSFTMFGHNCKPILVKARLSMTLSRCGKLGTLAAMRYLQLRKNHEKPVHFWKQPGQSKRCSGIQIPLYNTLHMGGQGHFWTFLTNGSEIATPSPHK